jgi:hypothetical protein
MPETKRPYSQALALLADNATQDISPQDVRDVIYSLYHRGYKSLAADYALTLDDALNIIEFTAAAVVTLPAGLPVGWRCLIVRASAGEITFSGTLNSSISSLTTAGQWLEIICISSGVFRGIAAPPGLTQIDIDAAIAAHEGEADPHPQYLTETDIFDDTNAGAVPASSGIDGEVLRGDGTWGTVQAGAIANNAVQNTKLSDMPQSTIKGRVTAGTGDPEDLTAAQARQILPRTGVPREFWVSAAAFAPRATDGAALASTTYATNNHFLDQYDFDDEIEEAIEALFSLPDAWDRGTIKARVYWGAGSGSGDVVWGLSAGALSDDDAIDAPLGTEQTITDTLLAAGDMHITEASPALTVGGSPALNDAVLFRVARKAANGSDTVAVDAKFFGLKIQYLESETEPSVW